MRSHIFPRDLPPPGLHPQMPAPLSPSPSLSPPREYLSSDAAHKCFWTGCSKLFNDAETLYNHLCNDHIGRKSTNSLCLTCKWKDCGTTCAKRDHITSHLRVHVPLKPHACEICKKSFKRPQDLKKHEKIHTEEHHLQHKHSKAVTVAAQARGNAEVTTPLSLSVDGDFPKVVTPPSARLSVPRAKSQTSSPDSSHIGVLPTPSPELGYAPAHIRTEYKTPQDELYLHSHSISSWDAVPTGSKRSRDYAADFLTDVKKQRIAPSYDHDMVERLNLVGSQQVDYDTHSSSFNPRSIAMEIRSQEELAAVNDFLLTLARDAAGPPRQHQASQQVVSDDFFDSINLGQLGLEGMPGIGNHQNCTYNAHAPQTYTTSDSYHVHRTPDPSLPATHLATFSNSTHASSGYPNPNDYLPHAQSRRHVRQYGHSPGNSYPVHYYHHRPTPPSENSSQSAASTPGNTTPPQTYFPQANNSVAFDYMRPARGPAPVAHLAPMEYVNKTVRQMVPLRSAPGEAVKNLGRPEPVEPKLTQTLHKGLPARLTCLSSLSSASLYPSLKLDEYKLPPLNYPSSNSSSQESTPSSSPSSPAARHTVLPSLRSITCPSEPEDLAKRVDRIEIHSPVDEAFSEERRRHMSLIKDMLVAINAEYRKCYGTLKPARAEDTSTSGDVEMTAA